jgi:Fe-S cluster assembly protein SufD
MNEAGYLSLAERLGANRLAVDPAWLTRARSEALARFRAVGFPTTRDEEWRFTSVAPIVDTQFAPAHNGASSLTLADRAVFEWGGDPAATLVFVSGRFAAATSAAGRVPAGVRIESLANALSKPMSADDPCAAYLTAIADRDRAPFTALNTAFLEDGAFVYVPDSTSVEAPIHVLFLSIGERGPTMAHPRVLVVLGAHSRATIVETYGAVRADRYLTNAVTEVFAGENAKLDHYKIQRESPTGFHVGAMYARAARSSTLVSHAINLGGSLVRNDVIVRLDGEGCGCSLNGLYIGDGSRLVDNHTTIDHAQPHCASREVYKGILADHARAIFNGKIIVRPDAQKTDAKQTNKALLLSPDAQINTKPQLEIFANDVKCTHGAAIGQMDDEALFYLRARGLSEQEARHMLIRAFVSDVLDEMSLRPLGARIEHDLLQRLSEWRGGSDGNGLPASGVA